MSHQTERSTRPWHLPRQRQRPRLVLRERISRVGAEGWFGLVKIQLEAVVDGESTAALTMNQLVPGQLLRRSGYRDNRRGDWRRLYG